MAIPILSARKDRKQAELQAAIDAGIEKALSPALAAANGVATLSGATYPQPNPSSPFSQTGGNFGSNPLPRSDGAFASLFGPGYPLFPDALDPLGPTGRAEPRRYQYRVTENIQIGNFGAPWTVLRQIASEVDIVSRCIELVQDAICGMEWSWGFSRQIINQIRLENDEPNSARATSIARVKYGEELTRIQKFWERPDERMSYTFTQWLSLAIWAHLVFDGIVAYPGYTLGGDLHSVSLLDTSTIKILLDNQGFVPRPPSPAYQQVLWGFPRGEFQAENPDDEEKIPNGYRSDQLAYYIRRPRLHTVYGFSAVEECINYATLYQQRQEWMHAEWSHGSTPKGVIKTTGTEGWTPEDFAYFQQITNDQWSGQTQRRQQVMVLRPGMEWDQLKDFAELYNNDLDEWLVMQIGAKFGVPQSQLGIPMVLHNLGSGAQNVSQMDLADKFSIDSLVNFLVDCVNDLSRRFMGMGPEITISATSGNGDSSDLARAQADASDVNNGLRTTNEIRAERGLPLMSDKEADVLRATAGNAVIFFPGQLAYQEATEQATLAGLMPGATPNASTPTDDEEITASSPSGTSTDAAVSPKSKSNAAETANRSVGHVTAGSNMVTPGTDRKSRAVRKAPTSGAPQPTSESGSYSEKGIDDGSGDDGRISGEDSPQSGSADEVRKELVAFSKWARSHLGKKSRPFQFQYQGSVRGRELNSVVLTGDYELVKAAIAADNNSVVASGICVRAADSGRVLLLQRALDDADPAQGTWEWPGGHAEDGESSAEAAVREWQEETGIDLPDGEMMAQWVCPVGTYETFLWEVPSESDVTLNVGDDGRVHANPDDHDHAETLAWFDVADLPGNSALRPEMQMNPWHTIATSPIPTEPATKSSTWYDDIPEDIKQLHGRDAYPNDTVRVVELDFFGRPQMQLDKNDRLIIERSHA